MLDKEKYYVKDLCEIFNRNKAYISRAIKKYKIKYEIEKDTYRYVIRKEDMTKEFIDRLKRVSINENEQNENVCTSVSHMTDEEYKKNMIKFVYGIFDFGGKEYRSIDWNKFRVFVKIVIIRLGGLTESANKFNCDYKEIKRFIEEKTINITEESFNKIISFLEKENGI